MSTSVEHPSALEIARRLHAEVLDPMKQSFVGKDEIVDLLGLCLVGGENLFLLGPPGTAKSALVHELAERMGGHSFDYLLTRFTEPNELFGPFDIRKLREGELVTNTEGMLPEASLVFLDELLNANSAILNSLLLALNERLFRRGKESRRMRALMFVGASNHLPEDEALKALFDRFLLRVRSNNVAPEQLIAVLDAGWKQQRAEHLPPATLHFDDVEALQKLLPLVDLTAVRGPYAELVQRIRHAGIVLSDRRAVKLQRLIAASALLCTRMAARLSDLWVLKHIWDTEEQCEVLQSLVNTALGQEAAAGGDHPRSRAGEEADAEHLARDLEAIAAQLPKADATELAYLRDRLGILDGRCQWVADQQQREFLAQKVAELWTQFKR
ncbi:MoxR-like ATPase [Chthoniobacter flavus]|uniref:AAA family ATPase n=1 Tax=Chthoniobacter flavus TaxID=191863 RepID=UPI00104B582E|nr:AAA family ATPase [Chthoniobacter flavus]TCO90204.1 MoxR-like ATPase [Chthoniobacter flavus]